MFSMVVSPFLMVYNPPENERRSQEKGPFEKERLVFQPSPFRDMLVLGGVSVFHLSLIVGVNKYKENNKYLKPPLKHNYFDVKDPLTDGEEKSNVHQSRGCFFNILGT